MRELPLATGRALNTSHQVMGLLSVSSSVSQKSLACGTLATLASLASLTIKIKEVATIKELLQTHRTHESHLDEIHLSACWTSLSRLVNLKLAERRWLQSNAEALNPLVRHTVRAAVAGEFGPRQLAHIAYAAARTTAPLSRSLASGSAS